LGGWGVGELGECWVGCLSLCTCVHRLESICRLQEMDTFSKTFCDDGIFCPAW
jgi:hypothetical protein